MMLHTPQPYHRPHHHHSRKSRITRNCGRICSYARMRSQMTRPTRLCLEVRALPPVHVAQDHHLAAAGALQAAGRQMMAAATMKSTILHDQAVHAAADDGPPVSLVMPQQQPIKSPQKNATAAAALEGRVLDLHLGCLPLLEQQFTVHSSTAAVEVPMATMCGTAQQFVLIAPADVDQVIDVYMEHDMLDSDPYWCRTWPSAIALAAEILARPSLVAGKRVADLGCGLGLAGLAAACSGAAEVVLLDREPLALQCGLLSALATAGASVEIHGLRTATTTACNSPPATTSSTQSQPAHQNSQHMPSSSLERQHPSEYAFHGGDLESYVGPIAAGTPGKRCHVRGRVFDWNAGPEPLLEEGGKFDVVLACDVLYEEQAVEPIARLVPSILKASGGRLLLADPPNRTAHHRQRFLQLLSEAADTSSSGAGPATRRSSRAARLVLEECRVVDGCRTTQLDTEMLGGLGGGEREEVVPVQLAGFRTSLGTDTVGVKLG